MSGPPVILSFNNDTWQVLVDFHEERNPRVQIEVPGQHWEWVDAFKEFRKKYYISQEAPWPHDLVSLAQSCYRQRVDLCAVHARHADIKISTIVQEMREVDYKVRSMNSPETNTSQQSEKDRLLASLLASEALRSRWEQEGRKYHMEEVSLLQAARRLTF